MNTTHYKHPKYPVGSPLAVKMPDRADSTVSQESNASAGSSSKPRRREPVPEAPVVSGVPLIELNSISAGSLTVPRILDLISRAGAILFQWDAYFGLTILSANARDLLGYTMEELMGDPDLARRVVDPEFLDHLDKMASGFFVLGDQAVRVEIPLITRSGQRVRMETRIIPEVDEAGRITGFLGLALNAADEVRARPRYE